MALVYQVGDDILEVRGDLNFSSLTPLDKNLIVRAQQRAFVERHLHHLISRIPFHWRRFLNTLVIFLFMTLILTLMLVLILLVIQILLVRIR